MPSLTTHQSWPGVRRRRDSHPSIHFPFGVYLPGTKTAGSGLTRLALGAKKSSFVAMARPPTRADTRSASCVKVIAVASLQDYSRAMLRGTAYGKSRVRLVQLTRRTDRHDLCDLTIAVRFQGDYDESYTVGDNSAVL